MTNLEAKRGDSILWKDELIGHFDKDFLMGSCLRLWLPPPRLASVYLPDEKVNEAALVVPAELSIWPLFLRGEIRVWRAGEGKLDDYLELMRGHNLFKPVGQTKSTVEADAEIARKALDLEIFQAVLRASGGEAYIREWIKDIERRSERREMKVERLPDGSTFNVSFSSDQEPAA